jgi:excisionase family DNA binding protein
MANKPPLPVKPRPVVGEEVLRLEDIPTVAVRLGNVHPKEVRRLIARGELFSVKLGRRRLIPSVEVDRYINALVDAARQAETY